MPLLSCEINLHLNWSKKCVKVATNVANQEEQLEQLKPGFKEQLTGININEKFSRNTKSIFRLLN